MKCLVAVAASPGAAALASMLGEHKKQPSFPDFGSSIRAFVISGLRSPSPSRTVIIELSLFSP